MNRYMWQILRPANVVTAVSDILAGISLAVLFSGQAFPTLSQVLIIAVASMCLYAGGVVFNDVFDVEIDKKERPERPIPSGNISLKKAIFIGSLCFLIGVILSAFIGLNTLLVALAIALMCLLYDGLFKHHYIAGPIAMGACRALNLLLGFTVVALPYGNFYILIFPIIYIAAITNISRGEVYGNNRKAIIVSVIMYTVVLLAMLYLSISFQKLQALPFILFFGGFILYPAFKAINTLVPRDIQNAVKMGVLGLIIMNAAWVSIGYGFVWALITLLLLPVSIWLSSRFKVT